MFPGEYVCESGWLYVCIYAWNKHHHFARKSESIPSFICQIWMLCWKGQRNNNDHKWFSKAAALPGAHYSFVSLIKAWMFGVWPHSKHVSCRLNHHTQTDCLGCFSANNLTLGCRLQIFKLTNVYCNYGASRMIGCNIVMANTHTELWTFCVTQYLWLKKYLLFCFPFYVTYLR